MGGGFLGLGTEQSSEVTLDISQYQKTVNEQLQKITNTSQTNVELRNQFNIIADNVDFSCCEKKIVNTQSIEGKNKSHN